MLEIVATYISGGKDEWVHQRKTFETLNIVNLRSKKGTNGPH